ncbi:hypothetical protein D3C72_1926340 [compost metagenome]
MGHIGEGVFRFDHLIRLIENLARLALAFRHYAGLLRHLTEFGKYLLGVAPLCLRVVPLHL